MDARFTLNSICFLQSQALVLWARLETCGDSFDPNPLDPRPLQVDVSFDTKFMSCRKRDMRILEQKLNNMELRAKAQRTMEEVRKALKRCIQEGKPPRSGSATESVGVPKEVKVEIDIKKLVQQEPHCSILPVAS